MLGAELRSSFPYFLVESPRSMWCDGFRFRVLLTVRPNLIEAKS